MFSPLVCLNISFKESFRLLNRSRAARIEDKEVGRNSLQAADGARSMKGIRSFSRREISGFEQPETWTDLINLKGSRARSPRYRNSSSSRVNEEGQRWLSFPP